MPNITIYLNDKEYEKFINLVAEQQARLKREFRNNLSKARQ